MKLNSKRKRNTYIIIAAIALAVLAIVGVIVGLVVNKVQEEKGKEIQEITISVLPKKEYFVGDTFDSTGIVIQVLTKNLDESYYVESTDPEVIFSGFDSSVANDSLTMTVSYKGFTKNFTLKIKDYPPKTPTIESIKLSDDFYEIPYTLSLWNRFGPLLDTSKLIVTYSDGTVKEVPMQYEWCEGVNMNLTSPGETQFTIRYTDENGFSAETTVIVTITN